MKKQEIYDAWKEKKRQIGISESFAYNVMEQVCQYEREKKKASFVPRGFVESISAHPLAQAALIAAGAVAGFIRLAFMVVAILSKGDING